MLKQNVAIIKSMSQESGRKSSDGIVVAKAVMKRHLVRCSRMAFAQAMRERGASAAATATYTAKVAGTMT